MSRISSFGIVPVPVQSQAMMLASVSSPQTIVVIHQWKVSAMNTPPSEKAAAIVNSEVPPTRRHCCGSASSTEVTSVSRAPSFVSGR